MDLGSLGQLAKFLIGVNMAKDAVRQLSAPPKRVALSGGAGGKANGKIQVHKVRSLEDRIRYIRKMVDKSVTDPKVRAHVASVLSKKCGKDERGKTVWCVPERDHRREIQAIFDDVQNNVRYTGDIRDVDTYQTAGRTLSLGIEDCDGYSIMLASMLKSVGYATKVRVIRTKDSSDWNHIFVLVGLPQANPKQWMALDGSVRQPMGWHPPKNIIAATKDFEV